MKPISTSETISPILKIDKKVDSKDRNNQQGEKQNQKNYKFCLFAGNNSIVFRKILLSRGNWEEIKENQVEEKSIFQNANFVWKSYNFSVRTINHFENNRGMCTKTGLIRSLSSYYRHLDQAAKYTVFDTCATSFVLTAGINDVEFTCFMARFNEITKGNFTKEKVPKKHCLENIWLLKPADANQGRGIEILKTQKDIISSLVQKQSNSYWVIQKYIEKPLLYHGRKFDIRMWALVTKSAEVFLYKTGYIRTCCDEYNMQDIDPNLHLTNNFVQKHHQNYGQHEPGNTLHLDYLFEYIDQKFASDNTNNVNLRERITSRMKDLIIDTILSVKKSMITTKRYNNFEFFGYDFLIDEDLRVWLIEVNTNPYIGTPNDFIKELVPKMADDLVKIVVDPLFPPLNPPENQSNDFELIYCENGSVFNNGNPKNVRQPYNASPYPLQKFAQKPNKVQRQYGTSYIFNNPIKLNEQNANQNNDDKQIAEEDETPNQIDKQRSLSAAKLVQNGSREFSSPSMRVFENDKKNSSKSPEKKNMMSTLRSGSAKQNKSFYQTERSTNDNDLKKKLVKQKTVQEQEQEEENEIQQNGNDPLSQQNKLTNNQQAYDPDQMYQNLRKLLNTYLYADFQPFYQHINNILSKMMNWELMSEQELKVVVKTLRFILESRISNILVDQKYIDKLIQVIDSQNHPIEIQEVSLEALCAITKNVTNKVRIVSKNIIVLLIKISLTSCDEKEMEKYDKKIRILATNCLIHLGGIYNRRQYIPGETRDNDKIRRIIIENGGLLSLLWIRKKVSDPDIKKIAQDFIDNLDISDFEMQYNLVRKWRKAIIQGQQSKSRLHEYGSQELLQLNLSGDANNTTIDKVLKEEGLGEQSKQNDDSLQISSKEIPVSKKNISLLASPNQLTKVGISEKVHDYPEFLSKLEYFDFQGSLTIAEDIYLTIKEQLAKKEKEEKLKREIEVKRLQQQDDERKLILLERKAKIEEFQKKKEEEKLKRRLEERRREERQKEMMAVEEKKRLQKFEEMQRRREELRKLQRIEEERKKLQEDDGQKKQLEIARYKKQLAGKIALDDNAVKQLDFINSRHLFVKSKENNDQSLLQNSLSNSITNIINPSSQSTTNNFLPLKVNNNSRSKLASLSNRNISQSPKQKKSNLLFSEQVQLARLSMKKQQFIRDDNFLKQSIKIQIKSPTMSYSQNFTSSNFKQRNQRQLSPIKIENHQQVQQPQQQENSQINEIQEAFQENQENMVVDAQ